VSDLVRHATDIDSARLAAILVAAGLPLFIVAGIVTPSGLYQEPEGAVRLSIIDAQWSRFVAAQVLWSAWLLVPALGFALLSRHLHVPMAWLPTAATLVILAGAVAGSAFVALQTADPQRFWLDGEGTWVSTLGAWLVVGGIAVLGIVMIQAPGWTGIGLVLAACAMVASVALLASAPPFYVIGALSVVALAPAIVLWRTG
jgi:hypothetical protein